MLQEVTVFSAGHVVYARHSVCNLHSRHSHRARCASLCTPCASVTMVNNVVI